MSVERVPVGQEKKYTNQTNHSNKFLNQYGVNTAYVLLGTSFMVMILSFINRLLSLDTVWKVLSILRLTEGPDN
ncbi:MAG: hypothetical protein ACLS36_03620 [Streptococcus sp.]